jgi:hypothetical protein
MRKRLILCGLVIGLTSVAVFHYLSTGRRSNPSDRYAHLPGQDEIDSITARINDLTDNMGIRPIPAFTIPRDQIPTILAALTPAERAERLRRDAEHSAIIGHLTIRTKVGGNIEIDYYGMGQNPVVFSVDGAVCIRGGDYKPGYKTREFEMYTDESLLLYAIIEAIYRAEVKGFKTHVLPELIKQLRISTGKQPLPPE